MKKKAVNIKDKVSKKESWKERDISFLRPMAGSLRWGLCGENALFRNGQSHGGGFNAK